MYRIYVPQGVTEKTYQKMVIFKINVNLNKLPYVNVITHEVVLNMNHKVLM